MHNLMSVKPEEWRHSETALTLWNFPKSDNCSIEVASQSMRKTVTLIHFIVIYDCVTTSAVLTSPLTFVLLFYSDLHFVCQPGHVLALPLWHTESICVHHLTSATIIVNGGVIKSIRANYVESSFTPHGPYCIYYYMLCLNSSLNWSLNVSLSHINI